MTKISQQPNNPVRIVALGGGTGLSSVLRGLKEYVATPKDPAVQPIADLAAIVTVTDDGGSSGRLRREYRVLPPGDIRNCMVALSKDEHLLGKLFQYRFPVGRALAGHSFGNLFLTALTNVTGDFPACRTRLLRSFGNPRTNFPIHRGKRNAGSGAGRRLQG